jgi:hypothetical protein
MCASVRRFSGHGSFLFFEGEEADPPMRRSALLIRRPCRRSAPFWIPALRGIVKNAAPPPEQDHSPITILVRGPSRRSNRSIADGVIDTQPAVGPKFSRAKWKNTALPRPLMRGEWL